MHIDKNLSWPWRKQIENTTYKLSRGIEILRKIGPFLQEKQLKNLYNSFMKPYTEYGALAWSSQLLKHILQRLIEISKNQ